MDPRLLLRLARVLPRRAASRLEEAVAGRLDPRRLCRLLTLEGWEHLDAAQSRGRGVVLLAARAGPWRLALLAAGLYRQPVTLAGGLAGDALLRRLAARQERRLGQAVLAAPATGPATPAAGELVAVLAGPGEPPDAAALAAGAPAVPLLAGPAPGGGWRVAVGEPIEPGGEGDPEALARRCLEAVAREVGRWPELAAGWREG